MQFTSLSTQYDFGMLFFLYIPYMRLLLPSAGETIRPGLSKT
jgi:hypothetical protein